MKNEMRAALLKQLTKAIGSNRMKSLKEPVEVIEIDGPELEIDELEDVKAPGKPSKKEIMDKLDDVDNAEFYDLLRMLADQCDSKED